MTSDYERAALRQELTIAIDAAADAEIAGWDDDLLTRKTLGDIYLNAMRAVEATGVPKPLVARTTRRMIEDRIFEKREKGRGVARAHVSMAHAHLYAIAEKHGYTQGYGKTRRQIQAEGGDSIMAEPRLPKALKRRRPDYSEHNAKYIEAFNSLADGMKVVAEWLEHAGPFDAHVEREYRETILVIGAAFRKNIHDLASDRTIIPTNAQPLAIRSIIAALSVDKGIRDFFIGVKGLITFKARKKGSKSLLSMRAFRDLIRRAPATVCPDLEIVEPAPAQWIGFHGQACERCDSCRTARLDGPATMLNCVACGATVRRRPAIYCPKCSYRVELDDDIRKSGRCPHCDEAVKWPPGGKH